MTLHKLLQHILLLLLVAGRLAHFLLALVVHHLLNHCARLAVQIAQLAVLGLNLGRVDLGRRGDDVRPPLHLVRLVEVDGQFFARRRRLEGPGAVVDYDGMGEGALFGIVGGPQEALPSYVSTRLVWLTWMMGS